MNTHPAPQTGVAVDQIDDGRLYAELRRIARIAVRNHRFPGLLQTTALINETWIRMRPYEHLKQADGQEALYRVAASVIRSILVDEARREGSDKRGGRWRRISISSAIASHEPTERRIDLLSLDLALHALAVVHPRRADIVEMRFFGGLTMPEIASLTGVSLRTVESEWQYARAWLRARLEHETHRHEK